MITMAEWMNVMDIYCLVFNKHQEFITVSYKSVQLLASFPGLHRSYRHLQYE